MYNNIIYVFPGTSGGISACARQWNYLLFTTQTIAMWNALVQVRSVLAFLGRNLCLIGWEVVYHGHMFNNNGVTKVGVEVTM